MITSFHQCLSLASRDKPLLVVLDGLELLCSNNGDVVDRYEWLPTALPSNVQLLVTIQSESDGKAAETDRFRILKVQYEGNAFMYLPKDFECLEHTTGFFFR